MFVAGHFWQKAYKIGGCEFDLRFVGFDLNATARRVSQSNFWQGVDSLGGYGISSSHKSGKIQGTRVDRQDVTDYINHKCNCRCFSVWLTCGLTKQNKATKKNSRMGVLWLNVTDGRKERKTMLFQTCKCLLFAAIKCKSICFQYYSQHRSKNKQETITANLRERHVHSIPRITHCFTTHFWPR